MKLSLLLLATTTTTTTSLLLLVSLQLINVHSFSVVTSLSRHSTAYSSTELSMAANEKKRRVVVTGLGVISGCGIGATDFFNACVEGKSSLAKVQRFDITHYPCQIASEVPESMFVAAEHFINPKNARSNDRFTHFAVAAARQALKDAKLGDTPETLQNPERVGVMVGSAFGGVETFEQETLKLHKKPERPKVGILNTVYCILLPQYRGNSNTQHNNRRFTLFLRYHFTTQQTHDTGLALYHSSSTGKYCIRSHWYRMRLPGSQLRYRLGMCQWQPRHW